MDKMRGLDDIEGITHFIARKFRNHDPMADRDDYKPTIVDGKRKGAGQKKIAVVATDESCVFYQMRNGRRFITSVREMEPEEDTPILKDVVL